MSDIGLYRKSGGVWQECQRPYVKMNGVWTAASYAYVKRAGVWTKAYQYDVTPPDKPEVSLELIVNSSGGQVVTRYIKVGLRMPGAQHDPDLKKIRLLTTYNGGQPSTQFGGSYWTQADANFPNETWSDWMYGQWGAHNDTSNWQYKQWPVNAAAGTKITADKTYYFSAWAMDDAGNWGPALHASIYVDKETVHTPKVVQREAYFLPNETGRWNGTNNSWQPGDLIEQKSPRCVGMWFYGNTIVDSIKSTTVRADSISIQVAQIYIHRCGPDKDSGQPTANVTSFWSPTGASGNLGGNGPDKRETEFLGQINKSQGTWFTLPNPFKNNMKDNLKSIGLDWKKPNNTDAVAADYSRMHGRGDDPNSGKVHVIWTEEQ